MEILEEKIQRVTKEKVAIEQYNSMWPLMFKDEKEQLLSILPNDLIKRIEHFGSTAVPSLSAKPIIDMLVEVTSLEETRNNGYIRNSQVVKSSQTQENRSFV